MASNGTQSLWKLLQQLGITLRVMINITVPYFHKTYRHVHVVRLIVIIIIVLVSLIVPLRVTKNNKLNPTCNTPNIKYDLTVINTNIKYYICPIPYIYVYVYILFVLSKNHDILVLT